MKIFKIKRDIFDDRGMLVLSKNQSVVMSENRIAQLKEMGILKQVLQQLEEENTSEVYNAVVAELTKPSTVKTLEELTKQFPGLDGGVVQKATGIVSSIVSVDEKYGWHRYVSLLFSYVDWLYAHSINTALISSIIAIIRGYSEQQVYEVAVGALFHDIGLTVIPRETLLKPTKLTELEYTMIKSHCEMGHSMMLEVMLPEISKKIILQHHERLDGTGYPYKLRGEDIHEASLITMVAEYCDTATTARSYKEAQELSEVIADMRREENIFPRYIVDIIEQYLA